jgi:hypothetical protein
MAAYLADSRTLARLLLWGAIICPVGAIAATFFVDGWPAQRFLILYVAPLFLAAPLWVRLRLEAYSSATVFRTAVDATVFILSFARFVSGDLLPFSGHMFFLTYSGLTTTTTSYRLLALLLILETTWFKLWLWRDPLTWTVGLILGILAAGIFWRNEMAGRLRRSSGTLAI